MDNEQICECTCTRVRKVPEDAVTLLSMTRMRGIWNATALNCVHHACSYTNRTASSRFFLAIYSQAPSD